MEGKLHCLHINYSKKIYKKEKKRLIHHLSKLYVKTLNDKDING